ncbi:MAG: sensor domain-containing phosphodiesterase, partial [Acidimicrobiales bacterium]
MTSQARLGSAIQGAAAPEVVTARVVEQALVLMPKAEGSAVELCDGPTMTYVAAAGSLAGAVGLRLTAAASLSGLSVRLGTTMRCDDARSDPRVDREACERVGAISMICVPLGMADRPVGVLKVTSGDAGAFRDSDEEILTSLAGFVTAAITAAHQLSDAADEVLVRTWSAPGHGPGLSASGASRFVANVLDPELLSGLEAAERIDALCASGGLEVVLQPIVALGCAQLIGAEALSRFEGGCPEAVFADAAHVGRSVVLELAAATRALTHLDSLPRSCYLAINLDPHTLMQTEAIELLGSVDPRRVVVELTEHVAVEDYPGLVALLAPLRAAGMRLAVDDTGAGFSSLTQIVELDPEIVKLD